MQILSKFYFLGLTNYTFAPILSLTRFINVLLRMLLWKDLIIQYCFVKKTSLTSFDFIQI